MSENENSQQPQTVVVVTAIPASPLEKEALYKAGGSFWMLLAAIVMTVSLVSTLVSNVLRLNLIGIVLVVLDLLIAIGFWITWAKSRKQQLAPKGIKLIKGPYVAQFVFMVIRFALGLIITFFTFNVFKFVSDLFTFVFDVICFASILRSLNLAYTIAQDQSGEKQKAGLFAAIVMILAATFSLLSAVLSYLFASSLRMPEILAILVGGSSIIGIVAEAISFFASIAVAVVLIKFAKGIKAARNK